MLDPMIEWFQQAFIGLWKSMRGLFLWLTAPFRGFYRFFVNAGNTLKIIVSVIVLVLFATYGLFFWNAAWIRGYDINWPDQFDFQNRTTSAGEQVAAEAGTETTRSCGRSGVVDAVRYLVTFNVDENSWISSHPLYKGGLFGIDWDATPFMDNKASFQRGVQQAAARVAVELSDQLGRVRGTSEVDLDLQQARGWMQSDQFTWYFNPFSKLPFGPTTPTQNFYRKAIKAFENYNKRLESCQATFDARADNLMAMMDRIAKDIGSTSARIKDQSENFNSGWFDFRADNQFYFAKGQLYALYGLLQGARADFQQVLEIRRLDELWANMEAQIKSGLELDPWIVSNGKEDGWIMPTHLTTIGFYILRVRSNLIEIRSVLNR